MRFPLTLRKLTAALRRVRLLRERRGGAAVMFGLLAVPIIGLTGLAIDVGFMTMAKSRMDLAADAASLAAAKTAATAFAASQPTYIAQGVAMGQQWFNGQAGTTSGLTMGTPTLTVSQNGGVFTSSLTYSGTISTTIARLFGYPVFPVGGTSSATITVGGYADINVLMDISSSMGIAGTTAAINTFGAMALAYNKTMAQSMNCAFGCHWDANNNDFYGLARKNNIPLRIDTLIAAVQGVVSQLISQNFQSLYRIGLYSFDSAFHTIYPISTDLTDALTAAKGVTVPLCCGGTNNSALEPNTNIPLALTTMTTTVGVSGNGATAAVPRKFVFLVTDGVTDYLTSTGGRVLTNLTSTSCSALKTNGVTVLVLYTVYPDLSQAPNANPFFISNVEPFVLPTSTSTLVKNLTACASAPEYYFQATDAADIATQMQNMLQIATSTQGRFVK